MATKTHFLNFILICASFQLFAQSDEQLLTDWTKKNEQLLLENNQIIESSWFRDNCLALAKQLKFSQIKQCQLINSKTINAFVFNNGHVYFTTAMMKLIHNKHQWASILAHENAHIALSHYLKTINKIRKPGFFFPKRKINKRLRLNETEADQWAENKLVEFNLDPNQVYYFLTRVDALKGKHKTNKHLKNSKRVFKPHKKELMDNIFINHIHQIRN